MLFTVRVAGCCRGLPADRKFGGAEQQISRTGITIPEDTVLQLELMNFLESKRNKVGDTVSVKLLEAVSVADEVIIPKGTVLEGYLKKSAERQAAVTKGRDQDEA